MPSGDTEGGGLREFEFAGQLLGRVLVGVIQPLLAGNAAYDCRRTIIATKDSPWARVAATA